MKETLSAKQARFSSMVGHLLFWIEKQENYRVTFGHAKAESGHMKGSLHYQRLAIDLNLFKKDMKGIWRYCTSTEAHEPLGKYWKSIGGSWGGDFRRKDGNHYSLEHNGMQ